MYQILKKQTLYYSEVSKKWNGKLKCENSDNIIDNFAGLRSKTYAFSYAEEYKFLNDRDKEKLVRCKGTTITTVKDNITFDSFVNTLTDNLLTKHDNYCITRLRR